MERGQVLQVPGVVLPVKAGDEVRVRSTCSLPLCRYPALVQSLRNDYGDIFGRSAVIVGVSPRFNSSFLVKFVDTSSAVERLAAIRDPGIAEQIREWNGKILDLHDQWLEKT